MDSCSDLFPKLEPAWNILLWWVEHTYAGGVYCQASEGSVKEIWSLRELMSEQRTRQCYEICKTIVA